MDTELVDTGTLLYFFSLVSPPPLRLFVYKALNDLHIFLYSAKKVSFHSLHFALTQDICGKELEQAC